MSNYFGTYLLCATSMRASIAIPRSIPSIIPITTAENKPTPTINRIRKNKFTTSSAAISG